MKKYYIFLVALLLITQNLSAQFIIETTSLEEQGLKGNIQMIEVELFCFGPVTSVLPIDTSKCNEVYHFYDNGKMSYYAFYDKFGECSRRVSVEYSVAGDVSQYVCVQFRDTIQFEATFDLFGRIANYYWKKNGVEYQSALFSPINKKGKVYVQYFEKGVQTKKIIETYNNYNLLTSEQIKNLTDGNKVMRNLEYKDSLLVSDKGGEQTILNKYDHANRLISTYSKTGTSEVEILYTYTENNFVESMTYNEKNKSSDKYVFEYDDKDRVVIVRQYLDNFIQVAIQHNTYDEEGKLLSEVTTETYNPGFEKTTTNSYTYDTMGNWTEQLVTVTVNGSSNSSYIRRKFTYF